MNFEFALDSMKKGKRMCRSGWNGKDMWVVKVDDWTVDVILSGAVEGLLPKPFLAMKTADNNFVTWTPSQTDLFAEDWESYDRMC